MLAGISKPLILVVISVLVVALVCGSFTPFIVFAVGSDPGFRTSKDCTTTKGEFKEVTTCCWRERVPGQILGKEYCQTCTRSTGSGAVDCTEKKPQALEQPPTPPPFDPTAPLQGGVLEQPPSPPPSGPVAPFKGGILEQLEQGNPEIGFSQQQQQQLPPADQGAAELPPPPPATEETQPATATEEEQPVPVCQEGLEFNEGLGFCVPTECPDGQVLDEQTGVCVLEEQPAAAEEPAQSESEEEQPSEESDSEDGSNN